MRSNTLMPMAQFVTWWGIDPWIYAGIDYKGVGTIVGSAAKRGDNDCVCVLQHPWQSIGKWSRDEFIQMVRMAEEVFISTCRQFPGPEQVIGELHTYPTPHNGFRNYDGHYKSIPLKYGDRVQGVGRLRLTPATDITLTRDLDGQILDNFTITATVPQNTDPEKIRVFFLGDDGGGYTNPDPVNNKEWEIRPLSSVLITNGTASIAAPAYVFKKPSLDEADECVPHELDTYVTGVWVGIEDIDTCSQGAFLFEGYEGCTPLPCEKTRRGFCADLRLVGAEKHLVPFPAECNDALTLVQYSPEQMPVELEVNYVSGEGLIEGRRIALEYRDYLSMMALCFADCVDPDGKDNRWCTCDRCMNNKFEFYRAVPKTKIAEGNGSQWQMLFTQGDLTRLRGLEPRRGILQATAWMNRIRSNRIEGMN